jgi:hypothetical protein
VGGSASPRALATQEVSCTGQIMMLWSRIALASSLVPVKIFCQTYDESGTGNPRRGRGMPPSPSCWGLAGSCRSSRSEG